MFRRERTRRGSHENFILREVGQANLLPHPIESISSLVMTPQCLKV